VLTEYSKREGSGEFGLGAMPMLHDGGGTGAIAIIRGMLCRVMHLLGFDADKLRNSVATYPPILSTSS
jgi:hypothetical protein